MSEYKYLTDDDIERIIKEEGVTRPSGPYLDNIQCQLCKKDFQPIELLEYFKVDFDEDVNFVLFGERTPARYGMVFCHRCYNIINCLMEKIGFF